jgi:hypothetical protein
MTEKQIAAARHKLARQAPALTGVLRGSLFERTIGHSSGCAKCDRGQGHPLWVLNVVYPGGKTRQLSLRPAQVPQVRPAQVPQVRPAQVPQVRPAQVPQVRRWLDNYRRLKQTLEQIFELNQQLLRRERESLKQKERAS